MPKLRTPIQEMTPEQLAVERVFRDMEDSIREGKAYSLAGELDATGNYAGADAVLRAAGVAPHVVRQRREHIDWCLSQGLPAIGDPKP